MPRSETSGEAQSKKNVQAKDLISFRIFCLRDGSVEISGFASPFSTHSDISIMESLLICRNCTEAERHPPRSADEFEC